MVQEVLGGKRALMTSPKSGEILDAAMELFSRKGYAATSMRDIADAVGLQAGSLYAHIRSKEDLLVGIIEGVRETFLNNGESALADKTDSVADRLRRFAAAHLQIIAENRASAVVFLHEWKSLEGEQLQLVLANRDRYESMLVALLEEGVENGEFRDVDPKLTAVAVLSLLNWAHTWYRPEGAMSAADVGDYFTDLVIEGIAKPKRALRRPTRR
ncbi:MAG TPA: TetR/AcrR family transcriptional regulator [Acidimicrobiales bacterium]|nr:TetR/AcrR family transcriptional regulator [Acidimicrobiales bacterium]